MDGFGVRSNLWQPAQLGVGAGVCVPSDGARRGRSSHATPNSLTAVRAVAGDIFAARWTRR